MIKGLKCPSCGKVTERFVATADKDGNIQYLCSQCPRAVGKEVLEERVGRKFRSKRQRKYDKWELPKDVIKETQKLAPKRRYPDSPTLRDASSVDKLFSGKRMIVHEWGSTGKSNRNARVMQKLANKLGPNPRIISDDGFKVVAESTVF